MTTNFRPSDSPSPHLHLGDDPAELLAMAHLSYMSSPEDDLVLIGRGGDLAAPVATRSALSHLLDPCRGDQLAQHLSLLQAQGCSQVFALLVVGDGYRRVDEEHYARTAIDGGLQLFTTAGMLLPAPLRITAAWVLGEGAAHELRLLEPDAGGPDIACSPPRLLRPFVDTEQAVRAVLEGRALPGPGHRELFARIGAGLQLAPEAPGDSDGPQNAEPRSRLSVEFSRTRTALRGIPVSAEDPTSRAHVTQCEQLASFLGMMAQKEAVWGLLSLCVELGNGPMGELEGVLEELFKNPDCRPHPDVQAGGSWFTALEQAQAAAAAARDRGPVPGRATAGDAWCALTASLVLLHWWNHRYASAGDLVDELDRDGGARRLAPLLRRLTDIPIHPAWWPRR